MQRKERKNDHPERGSVAARRRKCLAEQFTA